MPSRRGLRALPRATFADLEEAIEEQPPVDDRVAHSIAIDVIQPSPHNPRHDMGNLDELVASLDAHGLLQPIVVRRVRDRYEIIAGHRRYEAAKRLEWTDIPAVVRDETKQQAYILTLVENLQREDLTPKEEAVALETLVRERGWSTRQVGDAIKRSHAYVSRRLRVFEDPALAPIVLQAGLAVSTAEELLGVDEVDLRAQLATQAAEERWTPADARRAVRQVSGTTRTTSPMPPRHLAARIRELADELEAVEPDSVSETARRELRRLGRIVGALAPTHPSAGW